MARRPTKTNAARERHTSQDSLNMTVGDCAVLVSLVDAGFQHKRIASLFDINQGRVSEIHSAFTGAVKKLPNVITDG